MNSKDYVWEVSVPVRTRAAGWGTVMSALAWTEPVSARDRGRGRGIGGAGMHTRAVVADRGRARSPWSVYTRGPADGTRQRFTVWGAGIWTQRPGVNTLMES